MTLESFPHSHRRQLFPLISTSDNDQAELETGGLPLYKSCSVAVTAKGLHFDLCRSGCMSVRTPEEQKYQFIFSCADFTASFDSDKVLSAGDIACNRFMLNTTISEDLSTKSAKSTQPRHFFSLWWLFSVSGNSGSGSVTHFKQPKEAGCTATRWQSVLFAFPCFVSSLDVEIICGARSGLYFGTTAMMDPCLFPETIFFPVLSRMLLKSQAIQIRSMGLY